MPLEKVSDPPHVTVMPPIRRANVVLRTTLALVFGFMSLAHGPVMGFAKAPAAPQHRHMIPPAHAHDHEQSMPLQPDTTAVCRSFGCFVVVAPVAIAAPRASSPLLAKLLPARTSAGSPVWLDRPDPPPRLQV